MKNFVMCMLPTLVLAVGVVAGLAIAQDSAAPSVASESGFDVLLGR